MSDLDQIKQLICEIGELSEIDSDVVMYDAGFSSMSALQLLLPAAG